MGNGDAPVENDNSQAKEREAAQQAQQAKELERSKQIQKVQENAKSNSKSEKDASSPKGSNPIKGDQNKVKQGITAAALDASTEKPDITKKNNRTDQSKIKTNALEGKPDITAKERNQKIESNPIQGDQNKVNQGVSAAVLNAGTEKPDITKKNEVNDQAKRNSESEYNTMVENAGRSSSYKEISTIERNIHLTNLSQIALEDAILENRSQLEFYSNTSEHIPPESIERLLNNEDILKEVWISRNNRTLETESKIDDSSDKTLRDNKSVETNSITVKYENHVELGVENHVELDPDSDKDQSDSHTISSGENKAIDRSSDFDYGIRSSNKEYVNMLENGRGSFSKSEIQTFTPISPESSLADLSRPDLEYKIHLVDYVIRGMQSGDIIIDHFTSSKENFIETAEMLKAEWIRKQNGGFEQPSPIESSIYDSTEMAHHRRHVVVNSLTAEEISTFDDIYLLEASHAIESVLDKVDKIDQGKYEGEPTLKEVELQLENKRLIDKEIAHRAEGNPPLHYNYVISGDNIIGKETGVTKETIMAEQMKHVTSVERSIELLIQAGDQAIDDYNNDPVDRFLHHLIKETLWETLTGSVSESSHLNGGEIDSYLEDLSSIINDIESSLANENIQAAQLLINLLDWRLSTFEYVINKNREGKESRGETAVAIVKAADATANVGLGVATAGIAEGASLSVKVFVSAAVAAGFNAGKGLVTQSAEIDNETRQGYSIVELGNNATADMLTNVLGGFISKGVTPEVSSFLLNYGSSQPIAEQSIFVTKEFVEYFIPIAEILVKEVAKEMINKGIKENQFPTTQDFLNAVGAKFWAKISRKALIKEFLKAKLKDK